MLVDSYRFLPRSFLPLYQGAKPMPGEEEPVWAPFGKRLAEARIAVVTSAGLYLEGEQAPFDSERERREPFWGDPTHRVLPADLTGRALGMSHLHVNSDDVLADPNVAIPLDVLAELAAESRIGGVTPSHYSVMGFQAAGLEVWRQETAPAIVERLREEGADGVVLAPVWPDCCRNVPVLARWIEAAGIPTVVVTMMPQTAAELVTPRIVGVEFPFGHTFGMPGDRAMQRLVLETALAVLAGAAGPGTRLDIDLEWPQPRGEAYKAWQPKEPSPIVAEMLKARGADGS